MFFSISLLSIIKKLRISILMYIDKHLLKMNYTNTQPKRCLIKCITHILKIDLFKDQQ